MFSFWGKPKLLLAAPLAVDAAGEEVGEVGVCGCAGDDDGATFVGCRRGGVVTAVTDDFDGACFDG